MFFFCLWAEPNFSRPEFEWRNLCRWPDADLHSAKSCSVLWITQPVMFTRQSCWNNTRKMLRILVPLMCVKYIFFRFYRGVRFEENFKYTDGICWHCRFNFRYVTNKIVLICKFFSPEPAVDLFWILRVSVVGSGNSTEFFGCFIEANSEIRNKIKYLLR